jgi:ABC-type antimicrobial peptide transport system permease subunit
LTPVLGRDFSPGDRPGTIKSAIVTETLAKSVWPGQQAIGQTLTLEHEHDRFEIVGVAPNALFAGFQGDSAPNFIFLSEQQDLARPHGSTLGLRESGETTFYLRYSGNFTTVASAAGKVVKDVDSRIPIVNIRTMDAQLENMNGDTRMITFLLSIFSAISILIAAIGQYAVLAFDMRRRTREFGVRMAMGASTRQIMSSVVGEGLLLTGIGLGVGFALSAATGMALAKFLYGVTPTDPQTYLISFSIMAVASLLACYIPARRASRVDPLVALRWE